MLIIKNASITFTQTKFQVSAKGFSTQNIKKFRKIIKKDPFKKLCFGLFLLITFDNNEQVLGSFEYSSTLIEKLTLPSKNKNNQCHNLISTQFKKDPCAMNSKLKLGSRVSNIIWYITYSGKDHISIISKHPNVDKLNFYVLL